MTAGDQLKASNLAQEENMGFAVVYLANCHYCGGGLFNLFPSKNFHFQMAEPGIETWDPVHRIHALYYRVISPGLCLEFYKHFPYFLL